MLRFHLLRFVCRLSTDMFLALQLVAMPVVRSYDRVVARVGYIRVKCHHY
jgi:hypothetical protein